MGEPIPVPQFATHMQGPSDVRSNTKRHYVPELDLRCPGCGCQLEPYEVMACRIRGLTRPVCIGCLAQVVVDVRDLWLPLIRDLEHKILELAEKIPYERLEGAKRKTGT